MSNNNFNFHGSDLETIEKIYNIPKDEIISYSGNVNPLGISPRLKKELAENIELIAKYPDREYHSLKNAISNYTGASFEHIIVGNGSTELISLLINSIKPKKALIIGPTYSEYEKEVSLCGGSSLYYRLKEENNFIIEIEDLKKNLSSQIDLLVICNPNNPTSSAINTNDMRTILDYCKENDIFVMIDETYVEFTDNMNNITSIMLTDYYSNLMILRGVSKFFAAPGLRLGYGICGNNGLLRKLNEKKNPWTINALASLAGEIILSDHEYISKSKKLISEEREKVYDILSSWDMVKVFKPTANFMLLKILNNNLTSHDIFEYLIHQKIMIRDASSFPFLSDKFIRFCFLMPDDNIKILKELKKVLTP